MTRWLVSHHGYRLLRRHWQMATMNRSDRAVLPSGIRTSTGPSISTGPSGTTTTLREHSVTQAAYAAGGSRRSPVRWLLCGLAMVSLLGALDQAVVSTALPTVVGQLGGADLLSAAVTAYLLAATLSTPVWGRWGDRRGRVEPLLWAIGLFIVASALCGLSRSMPQLVGWRAVQGAGGAGLAIGTQAVLAQVIPARHRPRYLSLFGMLFASVSVIGPAVGGVITDHLGWRWIFYLNLPVAAAAVLVLARTMPRQRLAAPAPGNRTATPGWTLLRDRTFGTCAAIYFVSAFVILGITVYLPLFFQVVRGVSPTGSGLRMLPLLVTSVATALGSGWLIGRRGRYKIFPVAGAAIATLGLALLSLVGPGTPEIWVQLALMVVGIGMGGIGDVLGVVAQESAPPAALGVATATLGVSRSVGGVLGTAGLGLIFTWLLSHRLTEASSGAPIPSDLITAVTPARLSALSVETRDAVVHAYGSTLQTLLLVAAALYGVVFLLILRMPERNLSDRVRTDGTMLASGAPNLEPGRQLDAETCVGPVRETPGSARERVTAALFLLRDTVKQALDDVNAHRGRAALSGAGIALAVAALIVIVGLGSGLRASIDQRLGHLATQITVKQVANPLGSGLHGAQPLTDADVAALRGSAGAPAIDTVTPVVATATFARSSANIVTATLTGSTADYLRTANRSLTAGRSFTTAEYTRAARVVVLGPVLVDELFGGDPQRAVGQEVRIERASFTVIGALSPNGQQDTVALTPLSSSRAAVTGHLDRVDEVIITAADTSSVGTATHAAEHVLDSRHHITDPAGRDFTVTDQGALLDSLNGLNWNLELFALWVAIITLGLGSAGLTNVLLLSVTERTSEIGLRRAVGASRATITRQFLSESVLMAGAGGLSGVLAGITATLGAAVFIPLALPDYGTPQLSWLAVSSGLALSVLTGAIAGAYPARRAAKLQPADALQR